MHKRGCLLDRWPVGYQQPNALWGAHLFSNYDGPALLHFKFKSELGGEFGEPSSLAVASTTSLAVAGKELAGLQGSGMLGGAAPRKKLG